MSSPDFGQTSIPSESSRQDDSSVQKSRPTEVVCPSNSKVKMSSSPARKASPAISSLICMYDTPLASSRQVDHAVQISASSDHGCPSVSPVIFPPALFTTASFTQSSIPAVSDHRCQIPAPIWNPRLQTRPTSLGPFPSAFGAGRNFRSEIPGSQTLAADPLFSNYSGGTTPISNCSLPTVPCIMGKPPVVSISSLRPPIGVCISGELTRVAPAVSASFTPFPTESGALDTGSGFPPSSPAFSGCPSGDSAVDSAARPSQPCRVDSAVSPLGSNATAFPEVFSSIPIPPKVSFRDLVAPLSPKSSRLSFVDFGDLTDDIIAPTVVDGVPGILFPDQVISSLAVPFKFALIGRISGNRGVTPNQVLLKEFKSFLFLGSYTVKFLPRGFMVITFSLEEDYLSFWNQECVTIGKVSIRFSKWTPEFKFEDESSITPVWVRLPDLPLHLYDKKSLFTIARILGNPVKIDEITADASRGSFARICVEIDVLKPRPDKIWVGWGSHMQTLKVVYEKVPFFCVDCMMLGHSAQRCSRNGFISKATRPIAQVSPATDMPPLVSPTAAPSGQVLPSVSAPFQAGQGWFQKRRRRRGFIAPVVPQHITLSNRFEVLQSSDVDCPVGTSGGFVEDAPVVTVDEMVQSVVAPVVPVEHAASSVVEVGSTLMVVDSSVQESVVVPPVGVSEVATVVWPQVFKESPVPVPPYVPHRQVSRQPRVPGHQSIPVHDRLRPNTRSFKMKAAKLSFQPP